MTKCDVVVVGAGLAGLAAARVLTGAGLDVALLDAADAPGGRVRTDVVDGFLLDRGFQVLNPSYPELRAVADIAQLDLHRYDAAVQVVLDGSRPVLGDPRRRPSTATGSLLAPVGSLPGKARLVAYALRVAYVDPHRAEGLDEPDVSIRQAFTDARIPDRLVDTVLRPFLSGVVLDAGLDTSRRFGDLVLRSFVRGTPGLPSAGVRALPDQLAARLPAGTLRLSTRVDAVTATGVTGPGGSVTADAVVVATEAPAAAALLEGTATVPVPPARVVTTWYHTPTGTDPGTLAGGRPLIVVDGERRGPVVTTSVPTAATASYSPDGRALVSSSVLDLDTSVAAERAVRAHLARLYGVDTAHWELVGVTPVAYAQPAMLPPLDPQQPVRVGARRYVCGDHRDTASVQGALVSGRRAATAVLADLGLRAAGPGPAASLAAR